MEWLSKFTIIQIVKVRPWNLTDVNSDFYPHLFLGATKVVATAANWRVGAELQRWLLL